MDYLAEKINESRPMESELRELGDVKVETKGFWVGTQWDGGSSLKP